MRVSTLMMIIAVLPLGMAAGAQNKLTPREIREGWILLFDGETTYGWSQPSSFGAKWSIDAGRLQVTDGLGMLITTTAFGDFDLKYDYWADQPNGGGVALSHQGGFVGIGLSKRSVGAWNTGVVERRADLVRAGSPRKVSPIEPHLSSPLVSVSLMSPSKGTVRYRNIKLRPLGLKPIFNGKDMNGWKVIEGHQSVFSVTPEGWLNIKNGNGEIQTEGKWGDFLLQVEVYSNGDHLNSGVFFREEPGKFWAGYEAQIRNQWEGDDRTKAVDYGTGGLYNRQPARRVVSSDREWFTMTVSAIGNHIAIWVNGIQVCDFMDNRPANQTNARLGARTAPGVIGLQGHDPTTDLSFRNIRIAEMPAK